MCVCELIYVFINSIYLVKLSEDIFRCVTSLASYLYLFTCIHKNKTYLVILNLTIIRGVAGGMLRG